MNNKAEDERKPTWIEVFTNTADPSRLDFKWVCENLKTFAIAGGLFVLAAKLVATGNAGETRWAFPFRFAGGVCYAIGGFIAIVNILAAWSMFARSSLTKLAYGIYSFLVLFTAVMAGLVNWVQKPDVATDCPTCPAKSQQAK